MMFRSLVKDALSGFNGAMIIMPFQEKITDSPAYNIKSSRSNVADL